MVSEGSETEGFPSRLKPRSFRVVSEWSETAWFLFCCERLSASVGRSLHLRFSLSSNSNCLS